MGIEPGTSCILLSNLPDWANLTSVGWRIFDFTFVCGPNWLLDWDYLAKINRAWLYKDLKSLHLTSNAKLAQSGRHQGKLQEVTSSISTGCNFLLDLFSSLHKPLLTTPPTLYNYGKTRLVNLEQVSTDAYFISMGVRQRTLLKIYISKLSFPLCVIFQSGQLGRFLEQGC